MSHVMLGDREVGPERKPYIIAEIGANHNGDMNLCRRLIDSAVECGVDAVKIQSWSASSLICRAEYEKNTKLSAGQSGTVSLREMVEKYSVSPEQQHEISSYCREKGVVFASSVFSPEEVDLLDSLDVPYYKIASMDVTNLPLLDYLGSKGRPVILSSGMASLGEIERAMDVLRAKHRPDVVLLHCLALYPPRYDQLNLRNIVSLQKLLGVPVGFSDHTIGITAPLAAVALGAAVIEKHFTLEKNMEGWDHAVSADPAEMRMLVQESRNVFDSLGSYRRVVGEEELEKRKVFRRSVVARRSLNSGDTISKSFLDFKRPGTGISPDMASLLIGRKLKRDLKEDEMIAWSDLL